MALNTKTVLAILAAVFVVLSFFLPQLPLAIGVLFLCGAVVFG